MQWWMRQTPLNPLSRTQNGSMETPSTHWSLSLTSQGHMATAPYHMCTPSCLFACPTARLFLPCFLTAWIFSSVVYIAGLFEKKVQGALNHKMQRPTCISSVVAFQDTILKILTVLGNCIIIKLGYCIKKFLIIIQCIRPCSGCYRGAAVTIAA